MSPPTNSSAPGFAKQQRGATPVADFDRRLLVRWAVDAAEGVCLLFCALGGELFLNPTVPVQSFGSNSIKALRTRTGSGSENCIPDCGRPVVFVPKFAEVELTFPDPMYEFNTGDGG